MSVHKFHKSWRGTVAVKNVNIERILATQDKESVWRDKKREWYLADAK
jgi:hypothetical protein